EGDFYSDCTCPDWDPFCKHRAAVCYLVGERLDEDPFLLFLLRGRTKDQVLAALRAARAKRAGLLSEDQAVSSEAIPSDISPEAFWRLGPEAEGLEIHVRSPQIEMEVIKLLGDLTFAEDAARFEELAAIYRHVSRRALRLAFDESDVEG
ncbi:MAG: SWIM zinc finger family protein, partial [Chloroflexi bacterium]|nr:SWIM zinc finger family protein [Chloroflexota bacterium]